MMAGKGDAGENTQLKELLYRVEAERLHLQAQAAGLSENKQQLTADVLQLQQQLAEVHAAFCSSQQQVVQLTAAQERLQVQVQCATSEYRANDIIAVGLRDHITRLQHELRHSQHVCSQQAAEIATFAGDMSALRTCRADLTQQLSELQQQHQKLQEQHAGTAQQLTRAQQEAKDIQQRWVDEHGDQARQLQEVQEARQQAEDRVEQLSTQLEQEQQQLAQQRQRVSELECELSRIRELVVLLGKAMGRLPGGQQLPSHDDPVWLQLGPLGGVSFALDTVIKHTREQHVRVRELQAEFDKMEDRCRAESAQKADLQSELYDARTMYAKAIAVREALEARTSRAEAEKAAAEASLQQARTQAGEDVSRLSSLQEQVMSFSQQVQLLQPLQPKLSTAEVERDTVLHKLERLQEQFDQLQRQLQHVTSREAGLQTEVDAYKLEHSQLLAANTQLMAQCTALNKEVQGLEACVREGSAAKGQLEEAKRKLNRTKTQLQAMTDRHVDTLNKLETTKELLVPTAGGAVQLGSGSTISRPTSAFSRSRPSTATASSKPGTPTRRVRLPDSSTGPISPRASPRSSGIGGGQQQQQQQQPASVAGTHQAVLVPAARDPGLLAGSGVAAAQADGATSGVQLAAPGNVGPGSQAPAVLGGVDACQQERSEADEDYGTEQRSVSQDLNAMLRQRELEQLAAEQQQELERLRHQQQQQEVQIARLQVELLQQEAGHLQQLQASEAAVSGQCLAAAAEAAGTLQAALQDLRQALQGPSEGDGTAGAVLATTESCMEQGEQGRSSDGTAAEQQQQQQQQQQPGRWLSRVAGEMLSNMQAVVQAAQARAAQLAARQHVGVQSDEALQSQWLAFLRQLPDAAVAQPLHLKAASEAILRLYMRGLSQLEAAQQQQQQQQQQRQPGAAGMGPATVGLLGGGGGAALTVFDLLMAHYAPPAQQQQGQQQLQSRRLLVQPYSEALWRDPQGPITRLLVSCRSLAPTSVKVALFCCLAGTHILQATSSGSNSSSSAVWGVAHWQQFLLLLHAAKQLTGGLWKGLLRDCAGAGGALLPLQCVLDLLGNVYNVSSLAGLEQQPAVLGSRQALLDAAASSCSRVGSAAGDGAAAPQQARPGTAQQQQQQQRLVSVAAAIQEVAVDGPLGPASAVDFDDLLALLMVQFDAGLLPQHPLMHPRRLTTGDLGNTTNAWGSAATEAAADMLPRRPALLAAGPLGALLVAEGSEMRRSDGGATQTPNSPSGFSSVGGWHSRPTTSGTVAPGASGGGGSSGSGVTLPRIRTPDGAARDAQRGGSAGGAGHAQPAGALPSPNTMQGSSLSLSSAGKQAPTIRKGVNMARVAFRDPDGLPRDK